ncbi:hypothetical protein [Nannocystis bainbridge]|uniref:Uncharacterized protein n=1 Tax=Nannocystis bainbridge TaxID=2995303 RepID=A0ABT5E811_9BACT|nr:hypothetical protein [Nannocystis bainbridge]MDC0721479.1 hypothetical protein [Nannocystis bainbridge]
MAAIAGDFTIDEVSSVLDLLKEERTETAGEQWSVAQSGKNHFHVVATYMEVDPGKTRLAQRTLREVSVEIEKSSSGLQVRHSAQDRGTEILQSMVASLQKSKGEPVNATIIDLSTILDPESRTNFFINLGHNMEGFNMHETLSVRGSRMSVTNEDELGDEDLIKEDFSAAVKKIILTGRKVDHSPEYKRFTESRFFVSEMTWIAIDERKNGIKVEFEAGFAADESAQHFYYSVKRFWERGTDGEFKKSYQRAKGDRQRTLSKVLEAAAMRAQQQIFSALGPANTIVDRATSNNLSETPPPPPRKRGRGGTK